MRKRHRRRGWRVPACCTCACLVLLLYSPLTDAQTSRSGPQLRTVEIGGIPYLSLNDLAEAAAGRLHLNLLKQKADLRLGGHTFVFTLLSSVIVIDDVAYRMPLETQLYNGAFHVPERPFLRLFQQTVPGSNRLRDPVALSARPPPESPAAPSPPSPNLLSLQILSDGKGTRLVFKTDGTLSRDQIVREDRDGDRLVLLIRGGRLAPGARKIPRRKGYIRKLSVTQQEEVVRVDLRYRKEALWRHLEVAKDRIVLSLKTVRQPDLHSKRFALRTVIIDPGHGGIDPGAVGPGGTQEKEITLQVARRLKRLLEKRLKVNAVLTRKKDTFVPLGQRSQAALQNGGKLFISLHCNASKNRRTTGWEVYFLSDAKTAEAADVAQRENAVLQLEDGHLAKRSDSLNAELQDIAFGLLSTQFLKESQELAGLIRTEVGQTVTHLENRGVKQANFHVMRGTMGTMPSVLVEMGFISNSTEEKRLRSTAFQKRMAEAICSGVKAFKHRYEQQLSAHR